MMPYKSIITFLRRVFDYKFRKERNELLETRSNDYRMIYGLQSEGLLEEADRRREELLKKEKRFGLEHDYSLYHPIGLVTVQLKPKIKVIKVTHV